MHAIAKRANARSIKFYSRHKTLFESIEDKKVYTHAEMLSAGEHVILDIDHWLLFLGFVESHPEKDKFWELQIEQSFQKLDTIDA